MHSRSKGSVHTLPVIIIEIVFFVIFGLLCYRTANNQLSGTGASQGVLITILVIALALWLGLSRLVVIMSNHGFGPVKLFLIMYSISSLLYITAIPLYGTPDELAHFERIYGIATGHVIADVGESGSGGSELPASIIEGNYDKDTTLVSNKEGFDLVASNEQKFIEYGNTALYAPFGYTPQVIGVWIANIFTDRLYIIAYAGRIAGCIAVGLLLASAIRLLPYGKEIVLVIGLFPITIQEAVSLSGDGFTLAVATCFTAYVVHAICDGGGLSVREIVFGFVLMFFLGFCKFIYVPLLLMLLLVPASHFGGMRKKVILGITAAIMMIVECFGWLMITGRYLGYEFQPGVNVDAQKALILSEPVRFLGVFFTTIGENLSFLVTGMSASHLGIYNVEPPIWISRFGLIVLLAAVFVSWERGSKQSNGGKSAKSRGMGIIPSVCMLLICLLIMILVGVSLYLQWTAVGADRIAGIQGRYFLPILTALMLSIYEIKSIIPASISANRSVLVRSSLFVLLVSWVCLIAYYII